MPIIFITGDEEHGPDCFCEDCWEGDCIGYFKGCDCPDCLGWYETVQHGQATSDDPRCYGWHNGCTCDGCIAAHEENEVG